MPLQVIKKGDYRFPHNPLLLVFQLGNRDNGKVIVTIAGVKDVHFEARRGCLITAGFNVEFTIATDGQVLAYDSLFILQKYKEEREAIAHAYLHMVFHSVFRHMFVHTLVDHHVWDLACDIAVEYVIAGLGLKAVAIRRELLQKAVFESLEKEIKQLTAEKIYRYYLDKKLSPEKLAELRGAFYMDDHRIWYLSEVERALLFGRAVAAVVSMDSEGEGEASGLPGSSDGSGGSGTLSVISVAEARWSEISSRMQMDMETFSKRQGDKAGGLMQNLREVNREKYDYTEFLKKFAVLCP